MKRKRKPESSFADMVKKYINIRGLDIVLYLEDGKEIELHKNRAVSGNDIVIVTRTSETRIPISTVRSIDLFAA